MYISIFEVEGSGEFPFDMLRYDHCYPRHENEIHTMCHYPEERGLKKITLVSRCNTKHEADQIPTEGRWNSFTWRVVSREVTKF